MSILIATENQALLNILRFEAELKQSPALVDRLSYARSWYAQKDQKGAWRFAPSKFVGYDSLNAKTYIASSTINDGRRTEAQLTQWFSLVDATSGTHAELSAALIAFLAKYGKAPSTKMRINVLKRVHDQSTGRNDETAGVLVDLLVAVAKTLPKPDFAKLRQRLAP